MNNAPIKFHTGEHTDPDTGEVVVLDDNSVNMLIYCEQQIKVGVLQVAFGLKTIRDNRLFLLRDCVTMKDYIDEYFYQSYRNAKRFLFIADRLIDAKNRDLLENFSVSQLERITKNDTLLAEVKDSDEVMGDVHLPDGEVVPLAEYVRDVSRRIAAEQSRDREKSDKKINTLKTTAAAKDDIISGYKDQLKEAKDSIAQLEHAIQQLVTQKDIDPAKLVFVTHKKGAMKLLDDALATVLQTLGRIDGIPKTLADAEFTGKFGLVIASIEAGIERIRDNWGSAVWIPGTHDRPTDVVPE